MEPGNTTPEQPGLYIKATDELQIKQLHNTYPGFTPEQIARYIKLYGPLRANVIYNLDRKQKAASF